MKVKDLIAILSKEDEDLEVLISVRHESREFVYDIYKIEKERIDAACRKDFNAICLKPGMFSVGCVDHEGRARV